MTAELVAYYPDDEPELTELQSLDVAIQGQYIGAATVPRTTELTLIEGGKDKADTASELPLGLQTLRAYFGSELIEEAAALTRDQKAEIASAMTDVFKALKLMGGTKEATELRRFNFVAHIADNKPSPVISREFGMQRNWSVKVFTNTRRKLITVVPDESDRTMILKHLLISPATAVGDLQTAGIIPTEAPKQKRKTNSSSSYTRDDRDGTGIYFEKMVRAPMLEGKQEERELGILIGTGVTARGRLEASDFADESEQRELFRQASAGKTAKERFIISNLRLVVSIAKRYPLPHGMDLDDLIQEGNLGLEHAVDLFDWHKGFKFSTYATFWIRESIGQALKKQGSTIRLQGKQADRLKQALKSEEVGGDPTKLDPELYQLWLIANTVSLNKKVGDKDNAELGEFIEDRSQDTEREAIWGKSLEIKNLESLLVSALQSAPNHYTKKARVPLAEQVSAEDKVRILLNKHGVYDGEPKTNVALGEELGVKAEAVRKLLEHTVELLRASKSEDLRELAAFVIKS